MGITMRNRFLGEEKMSDLIRRDDAIEAIKNCSPPYVPIFTNDFYCAVQTVERVPSAQPELIRCRDCKFYSPMNRETKTGICNLTMHQNFGDNWFCAGAERRTDEHDDIFE